MRQPRRDGFTIVELLIVIVVIGILAAITVVAYNGVTIKAKDTQRLSDISTIAEALEIYYIENGRYPTGSGSTTINPSWSTTADTSWANLITTMKPHVNTLPADPVSTPALPVTSSTNSYNYAYYGNTSTFCGAAVGQMYILVYRLEGVAQKQTGEGVCTSNPLTYAGASNHRMVK